MRLRYDRTYRIRLYVAVLFMTVLYLISTVKKENKALDAIEMINLFMASRAFIIVLPAVVSLLCSDICFEDFSSRNVYFVLQRSNRKQFIFVKLKEILVISFMFVLLCFAMYNIVSYILTGSLSAYINTSSKMTNGIETMLLRLFISFVFCVVCGCMGSLFSVVLKNRSGGYVFPFIISYLLMWLRENYLKHAELIDPSFWLSNTLIMDTKLHVFVLLLGFLLLAVSMIAFFLFIYTEISRRE